MKIQIARRHRLHGSVLVVTLCFCAVLGVLIGSYLSLIGTQHRSVIRSNAWQKALVTAEAGVEEAMAQLNSVGLNSLALNSWVSLGGGMYQRTNFLADSY